MNAGNYGITNTTPGWLPWPGGVVPAAGGVLPAGVCRLPPNSLGGWISTAPGVTEKSLGENMLFHVANNARLHDIPPYLQSQPQFLRRGPVIAAQLGVPVEAALVRFFTLIKLTGPPEEYNHFNCTV